jgi:hypothetical protein
MAERFCNQAQFRPLAAKRERFGDVVKVAVTGETEKRSTWIGDLSEIKGDVTWLENIPKVPATT